MQRMQTRVLMRTSTLTLAPGQSVHWRRSHGNPLVIQYCIDAILTGMVVLTPLSCVPFIPSMGFDLLADVRPTEGKSRYSLRSLGRTANRVLSQLSLVGRQKQRPRCS